MRGGELSPRALLSGSAVAAIAIGVRDVSATMISDAEAAEAPSGVGRNPMCVPTVVRVNGIACAMPVEPNMTLAETLRGPLGLTGTKIACNCGACSAA